jgi:CheY-like chemotaxis protein
VSSEQASTRSRFEGRTALVVEDETIVSFLIEDMLNELGFAQVWHATNTDAALEILRERRPDAAVLDVNLQGSSVFPVADRLAAERVPFVFSTGYGRIGIPAYWAAKPVVQKPFSLDALASALNGAAPT